MSKLSFTELAFYLENVLNMCQNTDDTDDTDTSKQITEHD